MPRRRGPCRTLRGSTGWLRWPSWRDVRDTAEGARRARERKAGAEDDDPGGGVAERTRRSTRRRAPRRRGEVPGARSRLLARGTVRTGRTPLRRLLTSAGSDSARLLSPRFSPRARTPRGRYASIRVVLTTQPLTTVEPDHQDNVGVVPVRSWRTAVACPSSHVRPRHVRSGEHPAGEPPHQPNPSASAPGTSLNRARSMASCTRRFGRPALLDADGSTACARACRHLARCGCPSRSTERVRTTRARPWPRAPQSS